MNVGLNRLFARFFLQLTGVRMLTGTLPAEVGDAQVDSILGTIKDSGTAQFLSSAAHLIPLVPGAAPQILGGTCAGDTCTATLRGQEISQSLDEKKFGSVELDYQVVAMHPDSGITFVEANGVGAFGSIPLRVVGYGAWLEHNYFAVEANLALDSAIGPPAVFAYSYSIGTPSGSTPASMDSKTAKWSGSLVGARVAGLSPDARASEVIQGETEIFLDIPEASLDIRFSGVRSLTSSEHINLHGWEGVSVTANGFHTGEARDSVRGRFYGPNHEEAGGLRDPLIFFFRIDAQFTEHTYHSKLLTMLSPVDVGV